MKRLFDDEVMNDLQDKLNHFNDNDIDFGVICASSDERYGIDISFAGSSEEILTTAVFTIQLLANQAGISFRDMMKSIRMLHNDICDTNGLDRGSDIEPLLKDTSDDKIIQFGTK